MQTILIYFLQKITYHTGELGKLHSWFQVNKLFLNISKTNFMIFGNKQCEDNHVVSINCMNINIVYVTKFLEVHIDSHLNGCEHINHIKSNISKNVSIMAFID